MLTDRTGTKWEVLATLRENGELPVEVLETETGVSSSTLNEHLSDLRAMDLISKRSEPDGPGRPKHVYSLTEEAEDLFPHAYSRLASLLFDLIRSLLDEPEAREKVSQALSEYYEKYDDFEKALQSLGFFPEVTESDGTTTVRYHQCPFYEVAKETPSLCDIDEDVLESVTGKSARMQTCIVDGSECCEFVLTEN